MRDKKFRKNIIWFWVIISLPAVFLLDRGMNVVYAHRAKNAGDMSEIADLLAKL